ncbi:MAG: hypothetical protein HS111_02485 [Kofleriaceae bacterium]|nr:hypothetical protein [Kofleriaceae bacterium]
MSRWAAEKRGEPADCGDADDPAPSLTGLAAAPHDVGEQRGVVAQRVEGDVGDCPHDPVFPERAVGNREQEEQI